MKGISYFNAVVQFVLTALVIACFLISMGNKPRACVEFLRSPSTSDFALRNRAHLKYKLITIIFGVLMTYLLFTSILCGIEAARQGGTANKTMLLSVVITYGCKFLADILLLGAISAHNERSICFQQSPGFRSMAHDHQFRSLPPPLTCLYQHSQRVRMPLPPSETLLISASSRYAFANLDDVSVLYALPNALAKPVVRFPGVRNKTRNRKLISEPSSKIVNLRWILPCIQNLEISTVFTKRRSSTCEIGYQSKIPSRSLPRKA